MRNWENAVSKWQAKEKRMTSEAERGKRKENKNRSSVNKYRKAVSAVY